MFFLCLVEIPRFQFLPIASSLLTGHCWEESVSVFLTPINRYLPEGRAAATKQRQTGSKPKAQLNFSVCENLKPQDWSGAQGSLGCPFSATDFLCSPGKPSHPVRSMPALSPCIKIPTVMDEWLLLFIILKRLWSTITTLDARNSTF